MKMGKVEKSLILDSYIRRRKSNQNTEFSEKQKKRETLQRLSIILRKCETLRTSEEIRLLETGQDVVKQILRRQDRVKRSKERVLEKEDPVELIDKKAQELANVLSQARHLVCYTGAGISTSARIPDYRGSQGIWTLLQKGQDIGQHDLSLADPTYTHMALYELHRQNILQYVLSQNCDGLHLRSGLPRKSLSEVHGNMYIEVCKHCKPNAEYWRIFDTTEQTARYYHKTNRRCHICAKPLIDTIVHFGERGSLKWPLNWDGACRHADKADVILCLGSSLKVLKKYTWLWAMDRSRNKRPKIYIVNLQWTPKDAVADMKIHGKCDEVMHLVMKYMDIKVPKYSRIRDPIFAHANLLAPEEMHTVSQPMLKPFKDESSSITKNNDNKFCKNQLANVTADEIEFKVKKLKKELPDLIPIGQIGKLNHQLSGALSNNNSNDVVNLKADNLPPASNYYDHKMLNLDKQDAILNNETGKLNNNCSLALNHTSHVTASTTFSNSITSYSQINNVSQGKPCETNNSELDSSCQVVSSIAVAQETPHIKINSSNRKTLSPVLPPLSSTQSPHLLLNRHHSMELNGNTQETGVFNSKSAGLPNPVDKSTIGQLIARPFCDNKQTNLPFLTLTTVTDTSSTAESVTTVVNDTALIIADKNINNAKHDHTNYHEQHHHRWHFNGNWIRCDKTLTTNRTCVVKDSSNATISSISESALSLNYPPATDDIRLFSEKDDYKTLLNYCKAAIFRKTMPHWYDANYAYSGLHSIIHPPPNTVDIWSTIMIPIFQLDRREAECEFCFDHYAEYSCQFYLHRTPQFHLKKQRNGKVILCECCDYTDESDGDNRHEQQEHSSNDNNITAKGIAKQSWPIVTTSTEDNLLLSTVVNGSPDKCAKLNRATVKDAVVKVQAGWYGKGYRKMIRRKRRTKLTPLVTI